MPRASGTARERPQGQSRVVIRKKKSKVLFCGGDVRIAALEGSLGRGGTVPSPGAQPRLPRTPGPPENVNESPQDVSSLLYFHFMTFFYIPQERIQNKNEPGSQGSFLSLAFG